MRPVFIVLASLALYPFASLAEAPKNGAAYHFGAEEQKQYDGLTPKERAELTKEAGKKWEGMNGSEKKDMEEQAKASFDNLAPAEQQKMKADALKQWQSMSPEEQQEMKRQFPDLLKGDLKLDPGS